MVMLSAAAVRADTVDPGRRRLESRLLPRVEQSNEPRVATGRGPSDSLSRRAARRVATEAHEAEREAEPADAAEPRTSGGDGTAIA